LQAYKPWGAMAEMSRVAGYWQQLEGALAILSFIPAEMNEEDWVCRRLQQKSPSQTAAHNEQYLSWKYT